MIRELPADVRVSVLCGGVGGEREVSLDSGESVYEALAGAGVNVRKVILSGDNRELAGLDCDVAFLALHGEYGEDGQVQAELERLGVPYTGSGVEASALAMDKHESKKCFAAYGVPVAPWVLVERADDHAAKLRAAGLDFPVVAKPNSRGSSVGVSIVRDENSLAHAVAMALENDTLALLEAFIAGRELTVGVLEGRALPVLELAAEKEFYDYEAKYISNSTRYICPAPLEPEIYRQAQDYAERAFAALGLRDMARIDFMLAGEQLFALEANSIPGFTSHSLLPKAARESGLDFAQLCLRLAALAWNRGN